MAEEAASWKIVFTDSEENDSSAEEVAHFHTQETGSAAKLYPADRDALALPRMPATNLWVNENGKIVLKVVGDAVDIIESEESDGTIPIILKNKKSGAITHVKLRVGDTGRKDFSGFSATDDVTLNVSFYVRLGAYTVPQGYWATLDAGQPVHLFLGDDT